MPKEIRAFDFDIESKESEEHGHYIEGRAIVYDAPADMGWYEEIIDRGALDNTDLRDVRLLTNHDIKMIPLARTRNNNANSTMQLSVDEEGLVIRADLDTVNNTKAAELYSATKRGDISGMSFMFVVDGYEWKNVDSDYPTRHIRSIKKVMEVSACTFPAYEQTTLEARGEGRTLDSVKASLESARAEAKKEKEARSRKIKELELRLRIGG